MTATINPSTLKFLKDLAKNNNRPWFEKHKHVYLNAQTNMSEFAFSKCGLLLCKLLKIEYAAKL